MEEIILQSEKREDLGKAKAKDLRSNGFIPAVVYGQEKNALALKVLHSEFLHLVHQHRIESIVINLNIKGDKKEKSRPCIIKEIQYDPVHGDIIHVDFNEILLTKKIKVNVAIKTKGESIGVKQEGGSLENNLWEIEVECLPTQIPEKIEVDITKLKLKEAIHVKDLSMPANVKVLTDPEAVVLSIAEPMKEELAAEPVEGLEAPQEPEVIKEKKEEPTEEGQEKEESKKEK